MGGNVAVRMVTLGRSKGVPIGFGCLVPGRIAAPNGVPLGRRAAGHGALGGPPFASKGKSRLSDPTDPPRPAIDVVVPTYQNVGDLRACLTALGRQARSDIRVLVCVDGSTDGTDEFLAGVSVPFPLVVLQHPDRQNHGRAATRNLALAALEGEFVVFIDSDMRPVEEAIDRHIELLRSRDCVSVGDVLYDNTDQNTWPRYLRTRGKNKSAPGALLRALDFHSSNVALRTEHLRAAGGFDGSMFEHGGEDTEIALRLEEERGLAFVFNADALAISTEWKSVETALRQHRRYGATNLRAIRRTHPRRPAPYWIDHLERRSLTGRTLLVLMNPLSDLVARTVLHRAPFPLQRRALDYLVLRSVWGGYIEGGDS